MSESILLVLALVSFVFILVALVVSVACYILNALALSKVAKAKYINNPWLAWIPVANVWVLGSVADRIQDENGGGKIPFAKALTGLSVVSMLISLFSNVISSITPLFPYELLTIISIFAFLVVGVTWIVSIALMVLSYMAYYKIFKCFSPDRAVLYLVLSVVIPVASAVCLFLCAKNADAVTTQSESFDF